MNVHRYTGSIFLGGVTAGVIGATYLAFTTTFGWAFGFGILGLATAWASTTCMAYYAIRKGLVEIHKEWVVRAYIVTFAFVTFRVFSDYGPTSHLKPANDLLGGAVVRQRTQGAVEANSDGEASAGVISNGRGSGRGPCRP